MVKWNKIKLWQKDTKWIRIWKTWSEVQINPKEWYNHFMTTQEVFFNEGKTIFPELGSAECINCKKKKCISPSLMVRTS